MQLEGAPNIAIGSLPPARWVGVRERLAQCDSTASSHAARIDELEQEVGRLGHQLLTLGARAGDSHQLLAETTADQLGW